MNMDGDSHQKEKNSLETSRLARQIDPSILPYIHFYPASWSEQESWHESGVHNEYWEFFKQILECHSTSSDELPSAFRKNFKNLPFHEQLNNFELCQQLTEHQTRIQWQIAVDVLSVIRTMPGRGNCDAFVYGSLFTGLSNPGSAIDISVDIDGDNGQALSRKTQKEQTNVTLDTMKSLEVLLKNAPTRHDPRQKHFSVVQLSGNHHTDIQLTETQTAVNVRLTFNNQRHIWNSKLLKFYINFEPRTKQLIIFLSYWTKFHKISGHYNLRKWALTVLILVFLMQKNVIPSVLLLQTIAVFQRSERRESNYQDEHDSDICCDLEVVYKYFKPAVFCRARSTEKEDGQVFLGLLTDFFETVENTIFELSLVSPLLGRIVAIKDVTETASKCVEELPIEMRKCWNKLNPTDFKPEEFFSRKMAIFILDPFEPHINTAGLCRKIIRDRFVDAAKHTLSVLRNNPTTLLRFFVRPSETQANEFAAILEQSKGDAYINRLVDMFSKPECEDIRIHKEKTANEILQIFRNSLVFPSGLFKHPEQFDAIRQKQSTKFLETFIFNLYRWRMLAGSNDISSWQLTWQLTALWRRFVLDFLKDIFTTGLKLTAADIPFREFDDNCNLNPANTWTYDEKYTQKMVEIWKKDRVKILLDDERIQMAMQKLQLLMVPGNAIKYGVFKLKVTYPFWRRSCTSHNTKKCPLKEEAEISLDSYNNHLEETNKTTEAAAFIPFYIFVLYKLDSRADEANQVCGESSIMFLVQESGEGDVPLKSQQERKLARKCVVDTLQRTFDIYLLRELTHWINHGMKI